MQDPSFFEWLDMLAKHQSFENTIPLTDKQKSEQYNLEILIRFLVLQQIPTEDAKKIPDLETYLNEQIVALAADQNFAKARAEEVFKWTFDTLDQLFSDGAFRRPRADDPTRFNGPFLLAAFEVIAFRLA